MSSRACSRLAALGADVRTPGGSRPQQPPRAGGGEVRARRPRTNGPAAREELEPRADTVGAGRRPTSGPSTPGTVACIPFFGDGTNCPSPAGPDYDFGQAPALFTVPNAAGQPVDVVGVGQKSGQYWQLDAATGAVRWVTQAGPGGTAGGLQWGSAVDGSRVYTANANSNFVPWTLPDGSATLNGVWSGLDARTGQILWQRTPSHGGSTSGPVTTANGVVYGCSLDAQGYMYALDGATGAELWSYPSGGSCLSGAAISSGTLFWGSGYSNFGFGTPNHMLYAFGLPQ